MGIVVGIAHGNGIGEGPLLHQIFQGQGVLPFYIPVPPPAQLCGEGYKLGIGIWLESIPEPFSSFNPSPANVLQVSNIAPVFVTHVGHPAGLETAGLSRMGMGQLVPFPTHPVGRPRKYCYISIACAVHQDPAKNSHRFPFGLDEDPSDHVFFPLLEYFKGLATNEGDTILHELLPQSATAGLWVPTGTQTHTVILVHIIDPVDLRRSVHPIIVGGHLPGQTPRVSQLVHGDHPHTLLGRGDRGASSGGAAAHHQYVTFQSFLFKHDQVTLPTPQPWHSGDPIDIEGPTVAYYCWRI